MAEIDPRSFIFNVLDPWAGPWPKSTPEPSFSTVWTPGSNHGQNGSQKFDVGPSGGLGGTLAQKLDVRRFDSLGGAMAEIDPRALIFDALDPWAEPWPKSIPEA